MQFVYTACSMHACLMKLNSFTSQQDILRFNTPVISMYIIFTCVAFIGYLTLITISHCILCYAVRMDDMLSKGVQFLAGYLWNYLYTDRAQASGDELNECSENQDNNQHNTYSPSTPHKSQLATGADELLPLFQKSLLYETPKDPQQILECNTVGRPLSEQIQLCVSSFYGQAAPLAYRQVQSAVRRHYNGNVRAYVHNFLQPATHLLQKLKRVHKDTVACHCKVESWPLSQNGKLIVHLTEFPKSCLHRGDFYLCVTRTNFGQVQLSVKYLTGGGIRELLVLESDYQTLFTMDWIEKMRITSDMELGLILKRCVVAVENGIQRLRWEEVAAVSSLTRHVKQMPAKLDITFDFTGLSSRDDPPLEAPDEVGGPHKQRYMALLSTRPKLDLPNTIMDVDYTLLHSGVAILPGCTDLAGRMIIYMFTSSSVWTNQQVSSGELARLAMFYYTIPRGEVRKKGVTVVADMRGASLSTVNTMLEALYLFEANLPAVLSSVQLIVDNSTHALVLQSPVYDTQSCFQFDLVSCIEKLFCVVDVSEVPAALDGSYLYSHEDWVRFHVKFEPFMASCRSVAKYLIEVMHELSKVDALPFTVRETTQLIAQHEHFIKATFEHPQLLSLQNDGEAIMVSLNKVDGILGNSQDYRDAMTSLQHLHKHIQDSMSKLARLADTRLHKLEQCLQLREFEEECAKIISWLCNQGEDILHRHKSVADNLKAVRAQQKDFEKLYFSAMTHIEKGNDLLEEASMLSQSGNFDEATGYKDLARTLKKHLQDFTGQLEESREKIEGTAKCYHLLDKSYEWAVEVMRYLASMKMDNSATADRLAKLLKSLELYLREHPPITDETFSFMTEQADRLKNTRLAEQCLIAKNRCEETYQLLQLRQSTLRKAIHQLTVESKLQSPERKATKERDKTPHQATSRATLPEPSSPTSPVSHPMSPRPALEAEVETELVWEPRTTSTPSSIYIPPSIRRRSYSGNSSALMYDDPSLTFTPEALPDRYRREQNSARSDRHHSVDMSDRSIASVPKLRTVEEHKCLTNEENSPELRNRFHDSSVLSSSNFEGNKNNSSHGPSTLNRHERPHRKMFKRALSVPSHASENFNPREGQIGENGNKPPDSMLQNRELRALKSISMITASTESLPSMPEEDGDEEVDAGNDGSPHKEWTPVPVNTHLLRQNRLPTGSVADLRLTEAQVKSRRTLSLIMSEMVQTERDYVRSLQFIVENYVPELLREDVPQALRGKRNVIFGNIEKIYQFHRQYFLRELEACERNPFQVGHYFLLHENQFYLYALYNKNKPKSDNLMMEYGKEFFRKKQFDLGDKMDLNSYLLKPVQRMGKYALLLKQIIRECLETEPEFKELKASEDMVRFQLRHGNDLLAMDSLRECDVNLQEQGRLIRQEEFLVWQGRRKSLRHIFLFEDLVLFSKTRRGRSGSHETYLYKYCFKMSDIGLTENFGESGYKFELWFRRRSLGENYVFQAPNSDVKNTWVKEISRLLWKQAIKNRELRLCEMATMGIGNKPCLDIKPSADNINDRFINIAVGSRGARTRNSIAVCSFDHIRNGNKRPHSIISVSSTSSSNSSQSASSYAVFGSNLAFDPLESPRFTRRSFAASSNESGICADISLDSMYMLSQRHEGGGALGPRERPRSYHEYVSKTPPSQGPSGGTQLVTEV